MNRYLFSLVLASILIFISIDVNAQDAVAGESFFKQNCTACHTIGKGKLIGPDLANLLQRRPEEWILKFVKSSQTVIKSGDKYADSLFQAFNQMVMPDQPTATDAVVKNIIAYINTASTVPTASVPAVTSQQTDQQTGKASASFFTTTNILLLAVIFIMLLVIVFLARVNKGLTETIKDYYSSNKSFF